MSGKMKRKKNSPGVLLLAVTFFISCNTTESNHDPEVVFQSIWNDFATSWNEFDAKRCALFYAEDALNIPPELPVNKGRKSIEEFYTWLFSMHESAIYAHRVHSVSYFENQAVEVGDFQVDWVSTDGSQWQYKARSLTHWVKDENKNWKIKTFVFNTPPAES
jgi:uncharacterized protein (TIGR02246 family)